MSLFAELKRRNVIRVAVAYLVAAWLLIEASTLVFDIYGAPEWVSQVLVAVIAIGFPIALFFAWAFEITPEGIKREEEVDRSQSITSETAKRLDVVTIAMVVFAAGLLVADRFLLGSRPEAAPTGMSADVGAAPSRSQGEVLALGVAVLPFANLSADEENAYFASGVHEDVLTFLSRVADLRVISRTSVLNYEGSGLSLPAIGRELGVSHVVEGSVRRAGDRVRVTVQLIDAETDAHIWSENYDRTLTDIFAIQSEIAQAIVAQVEAEISPEEAAALAEVQSTSIEVYDLVAEARAFLHSGNRRGFHLPDYLQAADRARRASELDPSYRPAQTTVVLVCGTVIWFAPGEDSEACRVDIEAALNRLNALAPESLEARLSEGIYLYRVPQDFPAAADLLSALSTEYPNVAEVQRYLALAARRAGLWETAVIAARRSVAADPADPDGQRIYIEVLANAGAADEGISATATAMQRFPDDAAFRFRNADLRLTHRGEIEPYRTVIHELPAEDRYNLNVRPTTLGLFASREDAIAWWEGASFPEGTRFATATDAVNRGRLHRAWGEDELARPHMLRGLEEAERITAIAQEDSRFALNINSFLSWLLADLGETSRSAALRDALLADLEGQDDLTRNSVLINLFDRDLAAGELDAAWQGFQALRGRPGGLTEWDLYFDMYRRRLFGDHPEFQTMVARLDAELAAREGSQ